MALTPDLFRLVLKSYYIHIEADKIFIFLVIFASQDSDPLPSFPPWRI